MLNFELTTLLKSVTFDYVEGWNRNIAISSCNFPSRLILLQTTVRRGCSPIGEAKRTGIGDCYETKTHFRFIYAARLYAAHNRLRQSTGLQHLRDVLQRGFFHQFLGKPRADDVSSDTDSSQDGASSSAESEAADSSPYHPDAGSSGTGSGTNGGGNKVTSTNYRPVDDPNVVVPAGAKSTQKWVATDIVLTAGKEYANPYLDQAIHCEFKGPQGQKMTIPGFWDGGKKWVIRFAPPVVGKWSYQVKAADTADAGLHQVSGDLYCTKYTGNLDVYKHGFLRVSNDKRGMTYRDGTPFFWLADTHWMGLSHREPLNNSNSKEFSSMFKGMVDVRAKQGYTAYQMNFFLSESGDNGKLDGEYATWNEGGRVWQKDKKWVLPNTGFFSNCDERIQYLAGRGLVSALGFDWGPYAYDDKTVQSFQTAARYIVARYAAYPVVWITCGESRMNSPYWAEIARYVDKIDPYQHPTTLHSGVETQDWGYKSDEYRGEDWYDFAMLQTGHKSSLSSAILNSWKDKYNRTAVIPFLEAEAWL